MTKLRQLLENERIAHGKKRAGEATGRMAKRLTRGSVSFMLEMGVDIPFIMKVTKLSKKEILEIGDG